MRFEFDSEKSQLNKDKHGIDFEQAKQLWSDPNRIVIPAKSLDEARFLLIAQTASKHWSAVFTIREDKIRLISVRRSRENEKKIYES